MRIPRLQTVLYANLAFCLFSVAVILLFPGHIADYIINLPRLYFVSLSAGLLLFALGVWLTARQASPSRGRVLMIFWGDVAWVVLTPIIMLTTQDRLTSLGNLVLVDIALVVAALAAFEWMALGRPPLASD
ncbi:MAG: hypothetical protein R3F50_18600 [Gammaproteobacteria bacterium]|jgi:hypothetical protein